MSFKGDTSVTVLLLRWKQVQSSGNSRFFFYLRGEMKTHTCTLLWQLGQAAIIAQLSKTYL